MSARAISLLTTLALLACAGGGRLAADAARAPAGGSPIGSQSPWEAAKLRGVAFRGVGNEPGWSVEIAAGERIVMLTDYGRARVELPLPEAPTTRPTSRTTLRAHNAEHDLVLVIEPGPCQDSMSGETFESRVTAVLDARELRGCGRWLDAAPPARREGGLTPRRRLRA